MLDQVINEDTKFKLYASHIEVKYTFSKESIKKQPKRNHDPGYLKNQAYAWGRIKAKNLDTINWWFHKLWPDR